MWHWTTRTGFHSGRAVPLYHASCIGMGAGMRTTTRSVALRNRVTHRPVNSGKQIPTARSLFHGTHCVHCQQAGTLQLRASQTIINLVQLPSGIPTSWREGASFATTYTTCSATTSCNSRCPCSRLEIIKLECRHLAGRRTRSCTAWVTTGLIHVSTWNTSGRARIVEKYSTKPGFRSLRFT